MSNGEASLVGLHLVAPTAVHLDQARSLSTLKSSSHLTAYLFRGESGTFSDLFMHILTPLHTFIRKCRFSYLILIKYQFAFVISKDNIVELFVLISNISHIGIIINIGLLLFRLSILNIESPH